MPKASRRHGRRQQQRADSLVLHALVNGHRQLLDPVAHRLEHKVTDNLSIRHSHETVAEPMISRRELVGLLLTDPPRRAVETKGAAFGRKIGVEALQLWRVTWGDPAHTDVVVDHALIVRCDACESECRRTRRG